MQKQKNKERGITLIALVVTIIVLIILAGVSISMLVGKRGLIMQAKNSKTVTQEAEIIERVQSEIMELQVENKESEIGKTQLKVILDKYFNDVPEDYTKDTELTAKIEYGSYKIKISTLYSGIIKEKGIMAIDIANATEKSEFYGAEIKGYECLNQETIEKWQIFYADTNNIYIIASNYIEEEAIPYSTENGISTNNKPTINADNKMVLKDIIEDYTGTSDITDKRIQALNYDYFLNPEKGYFSKHENMKAVAYMLDVNAWKGFKGDNAEYAIGGPTIELLFKSHNEKYKLDNKYQVNAISNGYEVSADGTSWSCIISDSKDYLDSSDLLYMSQDRSADGMWIASPSGYGIATYVMCLYNTGCIEDESVNTTVALGFRPLVCLNAEIELQKNTDGTYTII